MTDAERTIAAIRRTELAAAQRVDAARVRADEILSEARAEARVHHREAEARGRERAVQRHTDAQHVAEEEAQKIRAAGSREAELLREEAVDRIAELAAALLQVVLPSPAQREV